MGFLGEELINSLATHLMVRTVTVREDLLTNRFDGEDDNQDDNDDAA